MRPLVELDQSADEAQRLLEEAIAADAHPGRGTGGWINFVRGWLSIRQNRRWEAAEGHMNARARTEAHAVVQLVNEFDLQFDVLDCLHYTVQTAVAEGAPPPGTVDLAYLVTLLDRMEDL